MVTRSEIPAMYKMQLNEIDMSCIVQSVDIIWCDKFPRVQVQSTNLALAREMPDMMTSLRTCFLFLSKIRTVLYDTTMDLGVRSIKGYTFWSC